MLACIRTVATSDGSGPSSLRAVRLIPPPPPPLLCEVATLLLLLPDAAEAEASEGVVAAGCCGDGAGGELVDRHECQPASGLPRPKCLRHNATQPTTDIQPQSSAHEDSARGRRRGREEGREEEQREEERREGGREGGSKRVSAWMSGRRRGGNQVAACGAAGTTQANTHLAETPKQ